MIVLAALAAGREVIVSRGELVEIGGGFRVPDVMAQSGASLREVGTTNKTRAADYGAAISDRTALILRVHPSNFRIEGFTERPALEELVALGKKFNIPVVEDLGSGYLPLGTDRGQTGVRPRPAPVDPLIAASRRCRRRSRPASTSAASAATSCSADRRPASSSGARRSSTGSARHPLMRALRVDKMTYAALEATLAEYAAGRADATVPVRRMLTLSADDIRARAEALAAAIGRARRLARRARRRIVRDWRRQRAGRRVADVAGGDREGRPDAGCTRRTAAPSDATSHRAHRARSPAAGSADRLTGAGHRARGTPRRRLETVRSVRLQADRHGPAEAGH